MKRTLWKTNEPLQRDSCAPGWAPSKPIPVESLEESTLVGSAVAITGSRSPRHLPVIDIDWPCELVASSTPGHFHLYIDKPVTWDQYRLVLLALVEAGIVERGYYEASVQHGQTFVRKPGLTKATS